MNLEFAYPWWLLALIFPALLTAGYIWIQRSNSRRAVDFSNFTALQRVAAPKTDALRHIPIVCAVLALVCLAVAAASPVMQREVERNRATVILAMDISLSMLAKDVSPSRIEAAQQAATTFAENLTPGINLGLVSFAGTAAVDVEPTTERGPVISAISQLELGEGTGTGESIYAALKAIRVLGKNLGGLDQAPPARIVLLSDGKQTVPSSLEDERGAYTAASAAKKLGIPISTISFGTKDGVINYEGETHAVPVENTSMKKIAELSGGDFYGARSSEELSTVYETLEKQVGVETKIMENPRPWMLSGLMLMTACAGSSLIINRRMLW